MICSNDELQKLGPEFLNSVKIRDHVSHSNLNLNFTLDKNVETFLLKGNYVIAKCENEDKKDKEEVPHYHCKAVFYIGTIVYNTDVPNIENLIKLMIYYTFNSPPVKSTGKVQMRGGTICPTKEIICEVDDKQFILYGRYIFGFDNQYVKFESKDYTFLLPAVKGSQRIYDHNYSFAIVDKNTNNLDAFGLYC